MQPVLHGRPVGFLSPGLQIISPVVEDIMSQVCGLFTERQCCVHRCCRVHNTVTVHLVHHCVLIHHCALHHWYITLHCTTGTLLCTVKGNSWLWFEPHPNREEFAKWNIGRIGLEAQGGGWANINLVWYWKQTLPDITPPFFKSTFFKP